MTAPAGEMGDDEILGLADALIAIHLQVFGTKVWICPRSRPLKRRKWCADE